MKTNVAAIILCFVMALALSACAAPKSDAPAASLPTDAAAVAPVEEAVVRIDYADDALLAQPDAYTEFIADDAESLVNVVLSTNATVKELKILSLNMESADDEGKMSYSITRELFTQSELTAEKPLVVVMAFVGSVPNMGVSYLDSSGAERLYAISMSGKDGSLLLLESAVAEQGA